MKVIFETDKEITLYQGCMMMNYASLKEALKQTIHFHYGGSKEEIKNQILKAKIKSI